MSTLPLRMVLPVVFLALVLGLIFGYLDGINAGASPELYAILSIPVILILLIMLAAATDVDRNTTPDRRSVNVSDQGAVLLIEFCDWFKNQTTPEFAFTDKTGKKVVLKRRELEELVKQK